MSLSSLQSRSIFLGAVAILFLASSAVLRAQDRSGGGTLVRDIMGGAALIFRPPDNPRVQATSASSLSTVGGGRLSGDRTARSRSGDQEQLIARGNAARKAVTPRYSEAEEQYKRAARQDPNDARAHAGLGNVYLDQNRFAEAVAAYQQAIKVRPDYVAAYMPLGYSLVRLNNFREAIETYKRSLQLDPGNPEIYNNLGFAYNHDEQYNEAVAACQQAIQLLGEQDRAYKQGLQNRDEVRGYAYKNLGNAYSGLQQYKKAVEALRQATLIDPNSAAAYFNLGLAHYNAGQNAKAVEAYKQVIKLKPALPGAHLNLGLAYVALHNDAAALEEYEALKKLNADMASQLQSLIKK
jgi:tetratricopeptide (TPR) repeat protein